MKRDPDANPIGPEPERHTSESPSEIDPPSPTPNLEQEKDSVKDLVKEEGFVEPDLKDEAIENTLTGQDTSMTSTTVAAETSKSPPDESAVKLNDTSFEVEKEQSPEIAKVQPSRDWADLSMMEKLECMHTVMEWHFQNPLRLRTLMRSDDEYASWVRLLFL